MHKKLMSICYLDKEILTEDNQWITILARTQNVIINTFTPKSAHKLDRACGMKNFYCYTLTWKMT